jgi:hypothetical protein
MNGKSRKLPNKPSELITVALDDLNDAQRHGRIIDMSVYVENRRVFRRHSGEEDFITLEVCHVCLAGAVIVERLRKHDDDSELMPQSFPDDVAAKLIALDNFRRGLVYRSCINLLSGRTCEKVSVQLMELENKTWVPDFKRDPRGFKMALRTLARRLQKLGI